MGAALLHLLEVDDDFWQVIIRRGTYLAKVLEGSHHINGLDVHN